MMNPVLANALKRSIQLDALAYLLIAGLMVLAAILGFMALNEVALPAGWVGMNAWVQMLGFLFIGTVVFYLLDQHGRLRERLASAYDEVETSKLHYERAVHGLEIAQQAAEIIVSLTEQDALEHVVDEVRAAMDADATAIIGERSVFSVRDSVNHQDVVEDLERVAAESVKSGKPTVLSTPEGATLVGAPLHVLGRLRGVLAVLEPSESFDRADADALGLVARVVELGWESRILFAGAETRAEGLSRLLVVLIDSYLPGYAESTARMRRRANDMGLKLGMGPEELGDLDDAVRFRDLGVLWLTSDLACDDGDDAVPAHCRAGARLATIGSLSPAVSASILMHHTDPAADSAAGRGTIPLGARVIRTAESFATRSDRAAGVSNVIGSA